MDYKQKYGEALNKAKSKIWNDKGHVLYENDIVDLFPELKESEDERIRKEIIKLVHFFYGSSLACEHLVSKDNMIAWLEKQGEQKPQGKQALEVWKDMRLEVYQQASGNRHESNYSDDSTKMFSLIDIDEIFEKVAEKQGEQKQFWNEDDEKTFNNIIEEIRPFGECPDYPTDEDKEYYYDRTEMIDWLKSLKYRIKGE